ncbi:MAG: hypothetical protein M1838_006122 [Thelocarpon superellum]|nr:MAG: hypothetical protein M1838_006122 [Thelocarpon superellum]
MPSRKSLMSPPAAAPAPSRIPPALQFPLLLSTSLVLSSLLYSGLVRFTAGDLGSVSRSLNEWRDVGGLIAWRATELGIGWWMEYDGIDLASLTLLAHLPPLYLLGTFYEIHPGTVLTSLVIDLTTTYLPFRLCRPLASRSIVSDLPIRALTTALGAAVYGTVLYASYQSWLPIYLVVHFDGIRDISAAHAPAFPLLVATCLPIGYAAQEFLFTAATGETGKVAFNPTTATFGETVYYNLWGYSARTKAVILRTATLVFVTGVNTWVQTFVTVQGVENNGAIGYATLWSTAAAVTGLAFIWVGNV